jgi:hypothetical protein
MEHSRDYPLIAYCGLYCGACSFKIAYDENNREHLLDLPSFFEVAKDAPLQYCAGCKTDAGCSECSIKTCAISRHLDHCGACTEFPCDRILKFNNDGIPHHSKVIDNLTELKRIGEAAWNVTQQNLWQCECGAKMSWYLRTCTHCGKPTDKLI